MIYAQHPILVIARSVDFCEHTLPVIVNMVMDNIPYELEFLTPDEWESSLTYIEPEFKKGELEWRRVLC